MISASIHLQHELIFSNEGFFIVSFGGTPMALQFLYKETSPFPHVGKTLYPLHAPDSFPTTPPPRQLRSTTSAEKRLELS